MKQVVEYNKIIYSKSNDMAFAMTYTNRQTGFTTGQILKMIGDAMVSPEVCIQHYCTTYMESVHFARFLKEMIEKLELNFFDIRINSKNILLTYKPIGRVEVTRQEIIYNIID